MGSSWAEGYRPLLGGEMKENGGLCTFSITRVHWPPGGRGLILCFQWSYTLLSRNVRLQHFKRMDFEVMEDIHERWMGHFFFFFKKCLIYLAAPGLSCGAQDFWSLLQHVGSWLTVFSVACELLVAAYGIWFPDQRLNPGHLHWEHGVLATVPPRKSQECIIPLQTLFPWPSRLVALTHQNVVLEEWAASDVLCPLLSRPCPALSMAHP